MRGAGLKALAVFLLLLVFLMGVSFEPCFARRRGKHWRTTRHSYFSSLVKKKAKWKGWTHHHYKKPFLSPPFLSPTPSPSPSPSHGFSHYPSPSPSPSHGFSHYPSPSSSPSRGFSHTPSPSHGHFHSPPPSSSPSHGFFHSPPPSSSPSHGYFHSPAPSSSPSHGFSHIPAPKPSPAPSPATHFGRENVFDVLAFGAKGDGVTDDTKAFMAAWASACKVEGSTVLVPADYEFLVGPISFSGPYCQPNIVFQLEGTIMAPTNSKAWGSGLLQWLEFSKLKGITITGRGTIEGRGAVWWSQSQPEYEPIAGSLFDTMPQTKPTALRFYGSMGVIVSGIAIQNSPQCHLKFDDCIGVQVFNLSISSPGNSLNTDGIHLQNSRDVSIHHVDLRCGDDCVSIQTGCSNVNIQSVSCGPGHGISIGGLGRGDTKACVSNITVQNVAMQGTMTGVRIKTWQGGSGSVQNIKFSGIRMTEVEMPIVIDQFYCDRTTCHNQTAAVALSGISYENIKGTYTVKPVHFACSDSLPCWDIRLANIELRPIQLRYKMFNPFCWQTFGELLSPAVPPIECLQTGKPATSRPMSELDAC